MTGNQILRLPVPSTFSSIVGAADCHLVENSRNRLHGFPVEDASARPIGAFPCGLLLSRHHNRRDGIHGLGACAGRQTRGVVATSIKC